MFYVITTRVVKVGTGAKAKFEPRTTNSTSLRLSGPFEKRIGAEKAAVAAMSTHTCLSATVWDDAEAISVLKELTAKGQYGSPRFEEAALIVTSMT